jgi:hypothetical protein
VGDVIGRVGALPVALRKRMDNGILILEEKWGATESDQMYALPNQDA